MNATEAENARRHSLTVQTVEAWNRKLRGPWLIEEYCGTRGPCISFSIQ
jgi:hypothetical protein